MKMIILLLLIFATIDFSMAKKITCGQSYDECVKGIQPTNEKDNRGEKFASAYTWLTGGRSICDDAFKLCVYLNKK